MNMVVCPEPLAAQAGQDVFAAGGNAFDAAIAAAFAQGVANPLMCGIGGTGLLYYYHAKTGQKVVLNCEVEVGSRPVPESWYDQYVGQSETIGRHILTSEANQYGHQSVMLPGFVRGCWTLYQRLASGKLSWAELLAPAIRIARDGFEVYPYIGAFMKVGEGSIARGERPGYPSPLTKLTATPDAGRIFLKPDGTPYQTGDWWVLSDYARTLERLAEAGGDDFYSGEIARTIMADFDRHDGLFTADDLRDYAVLAEAPLEASYRGYNATVAPPPSGGTQFIQMLKILEHFDLAALGHNTSEYIDFFSRVQRATFTENARLKGLGMAEGIALGEQIISDERVSHWVERLKAGGRMAVHGGAVDPGTTHVTVIDDEQNIVSFTHSIGSVGGSGVVTPGLGFIYNSFLGHLNPLPGRPDSIEPGKRFGGSVPAIIFKEGDPYLAIGSLGGSRIITSVTHAVINVLDHGMTMQEAVAAPRFHSEEAQLIYLESSFTEEIADALRARGNTVDRSNYMAYPQAIRILGGGELEAAPDPRGGSGIGRHP